LKKAIEFGFEKVAVIVIVLVFLAIVLFFIFSQGGPKDMIYAVINFLNSTSEMIPDK
jgi:lipopolysaccharide/colanic/teichoic acid biosynthesis glycosyltransferase